MDDLGYYTIALVLYVMVFGLVGWVIGERKGRPEAGFLFGALLGPIGWLIVAAGPDVKAAQAATRMRKCPYCAEMVQPDAKVCKHCGRDIAPSQPVQTTLSSSGARYYYSTDGGEQQGPVDANDLKLMRQDGLVTDETLVIREGESQWRSYGDYLALRR